MLRRPISWRWHVVLGGLSFATLAFLYTLWYLERHREMPDDRILPSWGRMYEEGLRSALTARSPKDKELILWKDFLATLERLATGMLLCMAVALPLGVLMGCYTPIEAVLLPPFAFLAKIPGTAMLGVFLVMPGVGLSERLFTAMIVFGIIPTLTQTIYHAAKEDVPEELLFKAQTLGASQAECIWDVVLVHILPRVLEAFRLSLGPALIFLFAAEMMYGDEGLGCRIRLQSNKGVERYPIVFFYLACAGLFGLSIDVGLRRIRRVLFPWYVQQGLPLNDIVLECRNVSHGFNRHRVLYDINLKIARGEIVSLVGPSGCGKTTLLRAILGTHPPREGQILMNGVAVVRPGRDRGIVYQRYSLFPFLTAEKNVAFGLTFVESALWERALMFWKWRRLRRSHLRLARDLLENKFKLGHALDLYPAEMSGGMCQRVAIAQALIIKPEVLLLDEPFGALDEATREEQQNMLLELYQENLQAKRAGRKPPYTMILVTHELNEAIYVSDRVIALSNFWDWKAEGLDEFPGATVVYDAASPASPRDPVHRYDNFLQQREEIRRAAFQPGCHARRGEYIRFWDEFRAGRGVGVMAPDQRTGPERLHDAGLPQEGTVGAAEDVGS